jgi:hypothetical protein
MIQKLLYPGKKTKKKKRVKEGGGDLRVVLEANNGAL